MSKAQIEFLQRCKALNLHSGSLNDWLDRIEAQQKRIDDVLALLSEQDYEYNRKTNRLIERHAIQLAASQAHIKVLREVLENCRLLAARHRKEEWATHMLRFCESGGSVANPLRQDDSALRELLKAERERCAKVADEWQTAIHDPR